MDDCIVLLPPPICWIKVESALLLLKHMGFETEGARREVCYDENFLQNSLSQVRQAERNTESRDSGILP